MKYLAIDIETTGLNPNRHQVIEFACVLTDLNDLTTPLNELPHFRTFIKHPEIIGEPYALAMNHRIIEKIGKHGEGMSESEFIKNFKSWLHKNLNPKEFFGRPLEKLTLAGKNIAGFDLPFLNNIYDFKKEFRSVFHHRTIDPTILFYSKDDIILPSLNLCVNRAELISGENRIRTPHEALSDAFDIVFLLRQNFRF